MDVLYQVSDLFKLAFGVNNPVFIPYPIQLDTESQVNFTLPGSRPDQPVNYSSVATRTARSSERLSQFGTPIVFPWTLKGGSYKVFDYRGELVDAQMEDFEMPAATLLSFEREKIITRTRVRGNEGTVKEMYGFDDWLCRVRGICLTDNSRQFAKTADEQKQQLLKWEKICSSVKVIGDLFFEKNIMALSIGKISFTQLEGKPDVIPFEFDAFSDDSLELVL